MVEKTFGFGDGQSGFVEKVTNFFGSSYSADTGWSVMAVRYYNNTSIGVLTDKRALFRFDTSSIPSFATISKVEFKIVDSLSQPGGSVPLSYGLKLGDDFIGSSLDGDAGEWGGGTDVKTNFTYTSGSWFDLDTDANDLINKGGFTCANLYVYSYYANTDYGRNFNTARSKCQLRVTYAVSSKFFVTIIG